MEAASASRGTPHTYRGPKGGVTEGGAWGVVGVEPEESAPVRLHPQSSGCRDVRGAWGVWVVWRRSDPSSRTLVILPMLRMHTDAAITPNSAFSYT